MRLDGRETLFVTGMDEHGLKMQQTAAREGLTPQALADRTAAQFEAMGELLNARADDIVRTTQPRHKRAAQAIWERMAANGDIYLSKYAGWYSVRDEAYFDEGELDRRPGRDEARAERRAGRMGRGGELFLPPLGLCRRLLAHYEANPDFVTPENYRNEIVAFVKRGLADLSISRTTFDWGVPVPGDPKHVMYVWVDALTNYITATGFPDGGPRAKFWPADAHVIGKDITRFHAIYWPAFLMSAGLAAAAADRRARLPVQPRRENVEVGRQRRRARRPGRAPTASTRCAISSCAKCRSARTAIIRTRRSSSASTPISPTTSAISRSARCR